MWAHRVNQVASLSYLSISTMKFTCIKLQSLILNILNIVVLYIAYNITYMLLGATAFQYIE